MAATVQKELAAYGLRLDDEKNVDWDLSNPEHPPQLECMAKVIQQCYNLLARVLHGRHQ